MKVLFIGGTGLISSACSELAIQRGIDLTILNRSISKTHDVPKGSGFLVADIHSNVEVVEKLLTNEKYDVIVDWIAFKPEDIERDIRLFKGKTNQFIFISSASAYQKPPVHYLINENTPLENPHWQYSRDKIACENKLLDAYRSDGFPVTIVRPSHTYGVSQIPLSMSSWSHPYTIVDRIKRGDKVIVPGDGTSLWVLTWNGDFAKGLLGLFGMEQSIGDAFHITSDEVLSWNQIYKELGDAMGISPKIIHIPSDLIAMYSTSEAEGLLGDKAHSVVFDNSKIKQFVPEFKCEIPWSVGIRRVLDWFEADPSRQKIDHGANQFWDRVIESYERAMPVF